MAAGLMFRRFGRYPLTVLAVGVLSCQVLAAILASMIAPYGQADVGVGPALMPPDSHHLFGTDRFGRDEFSRILFGGRLSLPVGAFAVGISTAIGSALGLVTGFCGGQVDVVGSRTIDIMLGFPSIMLALLAIAILGVGVQNVVLAVGIAGVPQFARLVRGATLSIRESGYVEAERALGAEIPRMIIRHVLPNVLPLVIVLGTLQVGSAILQTASLGFLGLGVQPPTAEWGTMLSESRGFMREAPWLMFFPGGMLFLTVMSTNLIGDFLRGALDPRLRGR